MMIIKIQVGESREHYLNRKKYLIEEQLEHDDNVKRIRKTTNYDDVYEHYRTAPSLPNAKQIADAFCEAEESFDNFENIVLMLDDIFDI